MENFSEKIHIENDNPLGWKVRAVTDIEAGEIILEEKPLLIAPHWDCERMKCANCCKESFVMCKKCQFFPLCLDCNSHDQFDCDFMSMATGNRSGTYNSSSTSTNFVSRDLLVKNYGVYAVLKLMLLMENEKTRSSCDALFPPMIDLNDEYRSSDIWQEHMENIVAPLMQSGLLGFLRNIVRRRGAEIDGDFLHELCFLIDVNAFEVNSKISDDSLKAVYTKGTKFPHSCIPNTVISFDEDFQMRIYTALPIQSGKEIFNCYVNPLMGTSQRQLQLRLLRQMICRCDRCLDPTELGSHMSSLKCQSCATGWLLCTSAISGSIDGENWHCNECGSIVETQEVHSLLTDVAEEMAHANTDLQSYERLLQRYASRFHPNHFIIIDIKQNIASILGGLLMNPYTKLDVPMLQRKMSISEEVLALVRIVQPGISKLYTIALYDYLIMFMELTDLRYEKKEITKEEYVDALQRAKAMIHEVVTMLSFEPSNSTEGHLTQRILMEKKQIEQQLLSVTEETT